MRAPVWVIDTNVLVSAALTSGGTCDRIVRAAVDGRIRLAWSTPNLVEYRSVLLRPKFQLSPRAVTALLEAFGPAEQVNIGSTPTLPDPDDGIFLATALATPDKILVTGNTSHFPTNLCQPVQVLTPSEALKHLPHS